MKKSTSKASRKPAKKAAPKPATKKSTKSGKKTAQKTQRKPLAVVTGGSSGIGFELAKLFLLNDYDVIIAAENAGLANAQKRLAPMGNVKAVKVDLAKESGVRNLYAAIKADGRPLDAIAINAGVGTNGDFVRDLKIKEEIDMISLNVVSTVHLAKLVLGSMVKRGKGRVLFTSSIASLAPGPYMATYYATKAFVSSFTDALRNELKDSGVTITTLMPGATETNFFHRAGMEDTAVGQGSKDDPADVAKDGFDAMMAGTDKIVAHSMTSKLNALAERILPAGLAAAMGAAESKPGSATQ